MEDQLDIRPTFWTIGHSTRPVAEFIAILNSAAIRAVGDVRRFPASRKFPHYNQQPLTEALAAAGISYLSLPELGGRRKPRPDSPHTAWRNPSFRAYADYMDTAAFQEGLNRVLATGAHERLALMCSEAVWWRCHRALIADCLKVRGYPVIHLFSPTKHEEHPYTSAATVIDGQLSYAASL